MFLFTVIPYNLGTIGTEFEATYPVVRINIKKYLHASHIVKQPLNTSIVPTYESFPRIFV